MDSIPPDLSEADQQTAKMLGNAAGTGGSIKVTTILSQWRIQPNPESIDPFTLVLYIGIEQDNPQLVSYVLSLGLQPQPLASWKALDRASIEIFQALFDHGWDIDAPLAPNMCPPLCYTISNELLVRWFLSHGASPNASTPQHVRTPVSTAYAKAPLHIVKLFYEHGASHFDALQTAAESPADGPLEVLRFLLDDGADVNAIKWAHHEVAYQTYPLLGLGTALHHAAKGGYADRAELLLSRGVNIDALDSYLQTPLEVAQRHDKADVVALLTQYSPT